MTSVTPSIPSSLSAQALASELIGLIFGILFYPSVSLAAPLSEHERLQAGALASALQWQSTQSVSQAASQAISPVAPRLAGRPHPLAQQTLSIERNPSKHTVDDTQVRVYQFDYNRASSRLVTVSLADERVLSVLPIQSVHLPLNMIESETALQWLATDHDAIERLRADQIRRGQPAFDQLSELSMKASIFVPTNAEHACAVERCALLSVIDKENTVFSMAPVINLQQGTVSWLFP